MKFACLPLALLAFVSTLNAAAAPRVETPYSQPSIDAPELAPLGPHGVGVRSFSLVERAVPDLAAYNKARRAAPLKDRVLQVDVWYPARPDAGARRAVYRDALPSEAKGQNAAFTVAGLAVRDARPDRGGPYPLVVMSHGYSGTPVAMSWLAENLASKGYVVAAPHHRDPPYGDGSRFAEPLLLRPLDIAFVAHTVQARARSGDVFFGGLVDPARVALAGYSMGGYGVLTVAGAGLSPASSSAVPGGYLSAYAMGGARAGDLQIDGLKAVVGISPAGGSGPFSAWGAEGLARLRAPTLLIVGDQDKIVGYAPGVKSIFDGAVNAPRYLLVFKNGAHSIGMNGAPEAMRSRLWDLDWFEDPVWRKERVIGVNLHMITAFLDLYVKGDQSRAPYLDLVPSSNDGVWPAPPKDAPYGVYSPGSGAITVWKGFQRVHSAGLEFLHMDAAKP